MFLQVNASSEQVIDASIISDIEPGCGFGTDEAVESSPRKTPVLFFNIMTLLKGQSHEIFVFVFFINQLILVLLEMYYSHFELF